MRVRNRLLAILSGGPSSRSVAAVENARKISPLPWWATEPVRARPSPARRASRSSCAGCSGASVATIAMQLPAGDRGSRPSPTVGKTGMPSIRRSRADPKFARTSTPIVASTSGTRRLDDPIPPFQPNATMPAPAPTHPCSTAPSCAAATAGQRHRPPPARCGHRSTNCRRIRRRRESRRRPFPRGRSVAHASATAPSKTRPTAIVEVRNTGVSISPHSEIWRNPVSSPAPFNAATPAGTGLRNRDAWAPGTIAVTPVLAIPRPSGGGGSSRATVTCPTRTPATSVIAFAGPASRWPMQSPCRRSVISSRRTTL